MKKLFASLILLCVMLVAKGAESDVNVAKGLVHRIAPQYENLIDFRQISGSADVFRLESKGGKTVISGNNAKVTQIVIHIYLIPVKDRFHSGISVDDFPFSGYFIKSRQ